MDASPGQAAGLPLATRAEYDDAVATLEAWAHAYYVRDSPVVPDATYDRLFHSVAAFEAAHPDWSNPLSPTRRVGGEILPGFRKARHPVQLLSLANVFDMEGVEAFDRRVGVALPDETLPRYVVEPKLDGLTLALTYVDGVLVRAATRGDGETGEEVTAQARAIRTIPLRLDASVDMPRFLSVRGEVTLPRAAFARLNEVREAAGEPIYQNPRNAAAGSVRNLDPRVAGSRDLRFSAYAATELVLSPNVSASDEVGLTTDVDVTARGQAGPEQVNRVVERLRPIAGVTGRFRSHWEVLQALSLSGFRVNANATACDDLTALIPVLARLQAARPDWDEETDGLVVKANDLGVHERLGSAGKDPRWAIAYKVAVSDVVVTRLLDITVQVGRTGAITPLATLAAVRLGGVTVTSATLHNEDQVRTLGLRIGDWVRVERAGGVIPAVLGVDQDGARRDGTEVSWAFPEACPACGGAIARDDDAAVARCIGISCPAQRAARLRHFAGRTAVDIAGLGANWIARLIDAGLVGTTADLYHLSASQLLSFEGQGMGEVLATKLAESIDRTRTTTSLGRFLFGLGVRHVGAENAMLLAPVVGSLDALREALRSDDREARLRDYEVRALETRGIGPVVARSFVAAIADPDMLVELDRFASGGMSPIAVEAAAALPVDGPLAGKVVVLTGTMSESREAIISRVVGAGGKVTDSVSGTTAYVVAGAKPGAAKVKGAARHAVPVISEAELSAILAG